MIFCKNEECQFKTLNNFEPVTRKILQKHIETRTTYEKTIASHILISGWGLHIYIYIYICR